MSIEDKVQSTELVKSKSWFQRARDYVGIDLLHLDNPHKCINSNPVTFYFFSDMILQEVVSQQKTSYDAGLKWSNRRFKKVAKVLAEKISEMPVQCYMAGLNWPHRNFELVADILANGIAQDPEWCSNAGRKWKDRVFEPIAKIIAEGVAKDARKSLDAGNSWSSKKFELVKDILYDGVKNESSVFIEAKEFWKKDRADYLKKRDGTFVEEDIDETVQSTEIVDKKNWFQRAKDYVGREILGLDSPNVPFKCIPLTFYLFKDIMLDEILIDEHSIERAGTGLPPIKFRIIAKEIAEEVAKDPRRSFYAGKDWAEDNFNFVAKTIAEGVALDPEWSFSAGRNWRLKNMGLVSEIIAKGITKDITKCFEVGEKFGPNFHLMITTIAKRIAKDPKMCYKVGEEWEIIEFAPISHIIAEGVSQNAFWGYQAGANWSDERIANLRLFYKNDTVFDKGCNLSKDHRKIWFNLAQKCDTTYLADLPVKDFYKVADVFEYAQKKGQEEKFIDSFDVVLERGCVNEWATEIQKRLKDETTAIGGDTYRDITMNS
jgi:hypothetical protein